ncbi:amidohydrolase family protein [Enterovirga rhinocerotis]|uniref:Cytosine/adenosine deaminase-related metal-dependent hydrolase n=1 Tax=Enterovirga rhinocerotis TaxID=1339210 RepID=A0A4R7C961_9HYPH|nr:amidohydrolase family protein [Enterovirga rhinocerotis]TDR94562.1 cytosine/adenosine deaminase-related metal-dependent hydrolase [Enterovirga rhinocerotis]
MTQIDRRHLLGLAAAGGLAGLLPKAARAQASAAPVLVRGSTVLTMVPGDDEPRRADLLVRDGRIAQIAPTIAAPAGADVIDGTGCVTMPGFVDAHTHGAITQMRGLFGATQETRFFQRVSRLQAQYRPEDTYLGMHLGAVESVASGITTVADFFDGVRDRDHALAGLRALRDAPVRGRLYYGQKSKTTADPIDLAHLEALQAELPSMSDGGRLSLGIAWRLPPNLDDEAAWTVKMREVEAGRRLGLPVQVHVSGQGPAMFDALIRRRLLFPALAVIHGSDARPDQLAALNESGASLVLTPLSEQRVGFGLTRYDRYRGVRRLGLGIDGIALAGTADMFTTLRVLSLVETGGARDETAVEPRRLLALATRGGAEALGLGDEIGSLTIGRRADLQMIDLSALNLVGDDGGDPSALLVHSARPGNVALVMVGGRIVKRDFELLGIDLGKLVQDARASIRGVLDRAK